ncbi:hypothetical protein FRC18_004705 [Serendipita sp. 400]|nr:hypothetical protein FRC18_004705 [Serendipita sp. 400]
MSKCIQSSWRILKPKRPEVQGKVSVGLATLHPATMTRITNHGLKRTYKDAQFSSLFESENASSKKEENVEEPPRKKRRDEGGFSHSKGDNSMNFQRSFRSHGGENNRNSYASEQRRQRRIQEKSIATTCFACRKQGHTARDCPSNDNKDLKGTRLTGICYRCGSSKHSLSRCPKPVDDGNPLPFASCFICHGKGHLSSSCPKNDKGVYPNGGSCKLCGQTSHLAKNCPLRSTAPSAENLLFNTAEGVDAPGADEDDFIAFKRKANQINNEERSQKNEKAHTKLPTAGGKKVVSF